jgi:hypothetical protein
MAVDLGPSFPITYLGIPPQISSEDLLLWKRFRELHAKDYVVFYFDVALGSGEDSGPGVSENVAKAWKRLTKFRADVVGDTGSEWHLIELRPNAGPGAVGAVQTYSTLWLTDPPDGRPVKSIIITDRCSSDIRRVAELSGVEVRCLNDGTV